MMNKAVLNSKLIAIKAGDIIIYNYDGETREYISTSTEYLAVGVGIRHVLVWMHQVHIKLVMQFVVL